MLATLYRVNRLDHQIKISPTSAEQYLITISRTGFTARSRVHNKRCSVILVNNNKPDINILLAGI